MHHLDERTYPIGHVDSLMTPILFNGEQVRQVGPMTQCIFRAMGWQTAQRCDSTSTTTTQGPGEPVTWDGRWYCDAGTYRGAGDRNGQPCQCTGACPGNICVFLLFGNSVVGEQCMV